MTRLFHHFIFYRGLRVVGSSLPLEPVFIFFFGVGWRAVLLSAALHASRRRWSWRVPALKSCRERSSHLIGLLLNGDWPRFPADFWRHSPAANIVGQQRKRTAYSYSVISWCYAARRTLHSWKGLAFLFSPNLRKISRGLLLTRKAVSLRWCNSLAANATAHLVAHCEWRTFKLRALKLEVKLFSLTKMDLIRTLTTS